MGQVEAVVPQAHRDVTLTITGGVWTCALNPSFASFLQRNFHLPLGYHPDPDLESARLLVSRYGGKVLDMRMKISVKPLKEILP